MINRVIKQYLRAFMHKRPFSWGKFLNYVEWSYNTSKHSGLGLTPYEVTFGKKPPTIMQYVVGNSNVEAVDDFLTSQEVVFLELRKKLLKAQEHMKKCANNNCREVKFENGDWVMVRLRPQRQTSIIGSSAAYDKLVKRYYGPYQVMTRIGGATYKLQLPVEAQIHPIFHCSLLKPFHSTNNTFASLPLPAKITENKPTITFLVILSTRWDTTENEPKLKVLVQWEGLSPHDASWKDWEQLKNDYHLEDKVLLDGIGSDGKQDLQKEEIGLLRPKRKTGPPKHLKDYVWLIMESA